MSMRGNRARLDAPDEISRKTDHGRDNDSASLSSLGVLPKLLSGTDGFGLDAITKLVDTFGSYAPSADESCCPNIRWRMKRICPAPCAALCPSQAISIADSITIDQSRCISCNICATACPHGVFDSTAPPDSSHYDTILSARKKGIKNIRFSCDRCGGRYGRSIGARSRGIETVVLPCLGSLSETLPIYALLVDCRVSIDPCPGDCRFNEGRECYELAVKRYETILQSYVVRPHNITGEIDDDGASGLERRAFLMSAGKGILRSLFGLDEPQSNGISSQLYRQSLPRRRRELLALTKGLAANSRAMDFERYPILDINLTGVDCDLCEICSKLCPTGALHYEEERGRGSISFTLGKCTGCRLCADVCPRECISYANARLGEIHSERRILVEKRLSRCKMCNFKLVGDVCPAGEESCPLCEKKMNPIPVHGRTS